MASETNISDCELPDAAIERILLHLDYEARVRCALVSKHWHKLLSGASKLWEVLPSQQVLLCNSLQSRPSFLQWLQPRATAVRACRGITASYWPLNIATELLEMLAPTLKKIGATYAHWGNLKALTSCTRLQSLSISLEWGQIQTLFPDENRLWQQLTHLELHIRRANLDSVALPHSLLMLPQLHTLILGSACPTMMLQCAPETDGQTDSVRVWPNLRRLWVQHAVPILWPDVRLLQVEELCLSNRAVPLELPPAWIEKHCPNVQALTLKRVNLAAFTGVRFWHMLANLSKLKHLGIMQARGLAEDFCTTSGPREGFPPLQSVSLQGCGLSAFPNALLRAPSLHFLDVSRNDLARLPVHAACWPKLQWLDVTHNPNLELLWGPSKGPPQGLARGPPHGSSAVALSAVEQDDVQTQDYSICSSSAPQQQQQQRRGTSEVDSNSRDAAGTSQSAEMSRNGNFTMLRGVHLSWLPAQQLDAVPDNDASAEEIADIAAEIAAEHTERERQQAMLHKFVGLSVPMIGLAFEQRPVGGRHASGGVLWLLQGAPRAAGGPKGPGEGACGGPCEGPVAEMDPISAAMQHGYTLAAILHSKRPSQDLAATFGTHVALNIPSGDDRVAGGESVSGKTVNAGDRNCSEVVSDGVVVSTGNNGSAEISNPGQTSISTENGISEGNRVCADVRVVGDAAWSTHCSIAKRLGAPRALVVHEANSRDVDRVWYRAFGHCDCNDAWSCRCSRQS